MKLNICALKSPAKIAKSTELSKFFCQNRIFFFIFIPNGKKSVNYFPIPKIKTPTSSGDGVDIS